jgi:hypothetical protein
MESLEHSQQRFTEHPESFHTKNLSQDIEKSIVEGIGQDGSTVIVVPR